ncbi:MAG: copper-binding protein [Hyphomicrobium sp.]|nr:copper-binding protein [Hyphomicrobium sp.]
MTTHKSVIAAIVSGSFALGAAVFADDANTLPMINGEVTKVDSTGGKVTIKHDAITNLDMGAMTMGFKASDPAMLKDLKPGDKIMFTADKVNGQISITKIEKAN